MKSDSHKRFKRVVRLTALFLSIGILYALFIHFFQLNIPCIFHLITGIRCPGCGFTHGMMALLHLDIRKSLEANILIIPTMLYVAVVYFHTAGKYIQTGKYYLTSGHAWLDIVFLVMICVWGIVRNIIDM